MAKTGDTSGRASRKAENSTSGTPCPNIGVASMLLTDPEAHSSRFDSPPLRIGWMAGGRVHLPRLPRSRPRTGEKQPEDRGRRWRELRDRPTLELPLEAPRERPEASIRKDEEDRPRGVAVVDFFI